MHEQIQQAGRTGRAGKEGMCYYLAGLVPI